MRREDKGWERWQQRDENKKGETERIKGKQREEKKIERFKERERSSLCLLQVSSQYKGLMAEVKHAYCFIPVCRKGGGGGDFFPFTP